MKASQEIEEKNKKAEEVEGSSVCDRVFQAEEVDRGKKKAPEVCNLSFFFMLE